MSRLHVKISPVRDSKPVAVSKSAAAQASADCYLAICKSQNITLEEFFKRHPGEYESYKKLAQVHVGAYLK